MTQMAIFDAEKLFFMSRNVCFVLFFDNSIKNHYL